MPNVFRNRTVAVALLGATFTSAGLAPAAPAAADPAPPSAGVTGYGYRLAQGHAALKRKDLDGAQAAFDAAAKLDPKAPDPLLGLAEVARLRNNANDVERWLQRALEVAPQSVEAQHGLGRYRLAMGKYADAEAALKKAAALDPGRVVIQLDLGELYLNGLRRPVEAATAYRQAIRLQPNLAGAHYGLGLALASQGKANEAVPEFEQAAKLAPANPAPLHALGRLYASQGDATRALEAFDRALASQRDFVPALLDRGDVLMTTKEPAKATADFEQAAKLAPKSAVVQFKLGTAYYVQGRLDDAEKAYRAAIEADPKAAPALNNLAALAAERKRNLDSALDWATRALSLGPNVPPFQDTLGNVHLARGELDPAIDAFRKAAASKPPNPVFHYNLGLALAQKGSKAEAIDAFKAALAINPGFAHAADARQRIERLGGM